MKFLIIFFVTFCSVAFAKQIVNRRDCGKGEIKSLDIEPCTSEPCNLKGGQDVTFTLDFVSNQDSNKAVLGGSAALNTVFARVPLMNFPATDVCPQVNCPIKAGNAYSVKYTVNVPQQNANNVEIQLTLSGDKGNTGCVSFRVNISKS